MRKFKCCATRAIGQSINPNFDVVMYSKIQTAWRCQFFAKDCEQNFTKVVAVLLLVKNTAFLKIYVQLFFNSLQLYYLRTDKLTC